jgi:hypothetical protein
MRVSKVFPVNLPIDRIDMYRWVTEMTTEDYESFTPAHKAMGSFFHGSRFFMVNVEYIGSDMLVQHYELIDHSKSHVKFYSRRTRGYVYRWFPVTFSVPWEMALRPSSSRSCELSCTIGAEFPSALLAAIARANGIGFFIRRHLAAEGAAFARDIELKFASPIGRPTIDN